MVERFELIATTEKMLKRNNYRFTLNLSSSALFNNIN
jgi:hypothetical protein